MSGFQYSSIKKSQASTAPRPTQRYKVRKDLDLNLPYEYQHQYRLPVVAWAQQEFGVSDCDVSVNLPSDYCDEDTYAWKTSPCQLNLELETVEQLAERYRQSINSFERSHTVMCAMALKWHALMQDVENDDNVADLFDNLQIIRKLIGGDKI